AFVKSLVIHHKGTIRVYSKVNRGTDIIVSFPSRKADYAVSELAETNETAMSEETLDYVDTETVSSSLVLPSDLPKKERAEHILIIDDHEEIRTFLRENLEDDYEISEAANGIEGLEAIGKNVPDLIICDLMMPKMDGMQFCREVKE